MTACAWIWALVLAPFWAPFLVVLAVVIMATVFSRDVI